MLGKIGEEDFKKYEELSLIIDKIIDDFISDSDFSALMNKYNQKNR